MDDALIINDNNYFPLLIEFTDGSGIQITCNTPDDLPCAIPFRVLEINWIHKERKH